MPPPIVFIGTCPNCGESASISLLIAWQDYLANVTWQCPHCREVTTTEAIREPADWQDADDRGEDANDE